MLTMQSLETCAMCDDLTEADNIDYLARLSVDRRRFAVMGAGAATLATIPGCIA